MRFTEENRRFEIRQQAINDGMVSLEDSTRRKVLDKVTSISELERVISDTEQSRSVRDLPQTISTRLRI